MAPDEVLQWAALLHTRLQGHKGWAAPARHHLLLSLEQPQPVHCWAQPGLQALACSAQPQPALVTGMAGSPQAAHHSCSAPLDGPLIARCPGAAVVEAFT